MTAKNWLGDAENVAASSGVGMAVRKCEGRELRGDLFLAEQKMCQIVNFKMCANTRC